MYTRLRVKYTLFLPGFNRLKLLQPIKETTILDLIKIRPVEAELFHADEYTWKAISRFHNFEKALKK